MKSKQKIKCGNCSSVNVVKRGFQKNKLQTIQKYQCKDCNSIFTTEQAKGKIYPIKLILQAISTYNLGYNLEQTAEKINKKYNLTINTKTINNWINEYKPLCTFARLRNQAIKQYSPKNIIQKQTLNHIQPYTFKYHQAKLELLFKDRLYNNEFINSSRFYEPIKSYLNKIPTDKFPHHIFTYHKDNNTTTTKAHSSDAEIEKNRNIELRNNEQRASQIKFKHLKIKKLSKNNLANKLTALALNLAKTNNQRHDAIQNFMLINDSTTIAVEVPVYLTNWDAGYYRNQKGFIFPLNNYQTPITGHIDLLQIRNGLIHILDYKPDAKNQSPIEQLTIYALALSRKLNLPLYYFKCAWFDAQNYYEFFPLHAVYEKRYPNE